MKKRIIGKIIPLCFCLSFLLSISFAGVSVAETTTGISVGDYFVWKTVDSSDEFQYVTMEKINSISGEYFLYSVKVEKTSYYGSEDSPVVARDVVSTNFEDMNRMKDSYSSLYSEYSATYGGKLINVTKFDLSEDSIWGDTVEYKVYDNSTGVLVEIQYTTTYNLAPGYKTMLDGWDYIEDLQKEYQPEKGIDGFELLPFLFIGFVSGYLLMIKKTNKI